MEEEFNRSTSAEQAVVSIGSRIQVLTSKLRGRLHEMQGEHGRLPAVARGLMELDQEIGPADCLAASIGVLGGSDRPGRQWQEPQRLLSVVRGGIGRIKDFERVQVRQLPELGVDGGLVDHLTLIFAHLLDNAARYSPPTEPVIVSGKEVPNGVGIEIQDAGKGLSEEKKREARAGPRRRRRRPRASAVSRRTRNSACASWAPWPAATASGSPSRTRRGSAPRWSWWYRTSTSARCPRAVTGTATAPAAAGRAEPAAAAAAGARPRPRTPVDTTPGGLPRRRSRRHEAARHEPAAPERTERTEDDRAAVPPDASFAGLAAFATAGRSRSPDGRLRPDSGPADGPTRVHRAPH